MAKGLQGAGHGLALVVGLACTAGFRFAFPSPGDGAAGLWAGLLAPAAIVVVSLSIAAAHKRFEAVLAQREVYALLTAVGAVGLLLTALSSAPAHTSQPLFVVGQLCAGAYFAAASLAWLLQLARLPFGRLVVLYSTSQAAYAALCLVLDAVPSSAASVLLLLLLLASLACFVAVAPRPVTAPASAQAFEEDDEARRSEGAMGKVPARALVILLVVSFVQTCASSGGSAPAWPGHAGVLAAAVALLVAAVVLKERLSLLAFYDVVLPLAVLGLLLPVTGEVGSLPTGSSLMGSSLFASAAWETMVVMMMTTFIEVARRYGVSVLVLLGLLRAMIAAARGAAVVVVAEGVAASVAGDALICVVLVVAFVVLHQFCSPGPDAETTWGIVPKDTATEAWSEDRLLLLARRYGLTRREEEVLGLLLDGLTASQAAHAMVVSDSTVKTHIQHIYRKMGVHSRQELARKASADR